MKRDRKQWSTGNIDLLEYLSNKRERDFKTISDDPLDILIAKEEVNAEETEINIWSSIEAVLSPYEFDIMFEYFFEGRTLAEMATDRGYDTPSAIFKQKAKILTKLKKELGNV